MTKEEILAMQPGEELDVLISEGIMGRPRPDFIPEHALELALAGTPVRYNGWLCICFYDEGDVPKWIPNPYSTDISAAWPIAVKMGLALIPLNNKDWACCKADHIYRVDIRQDHYADPNLVICKEAPEAISKVALLTREIKKLEGEG